MILNEREKETLMQIATVFRERAIGKYVINDENYKCLTEIAEDAENDFLEMELPDDKREQINQLLQKRLDAEECGQTLLYVAGVLNGISFLRDLGFLELIFEEDEPIGVDPKDCYLAAVIPGKEGCTAVHTYYGRKLAWFLKKWNGRGVSLFVVNRPENYPEYEPYRFVASLNDFLDIIVPFMKSESESPNEEIK